MKITENFALAVKPIHLAFRHVTMTTQKRDWRIIFRHGGGSSHETVLTEYDMWAALQRHEPDIEQFLAQDTLENQALARRMSMFLLEGAVSVAEKEKALLQEMARVHLIVMDHLGFELSMARKCCTRANARWQVSWFYTRATTTMIFEPEKLLVTGRYLPSITEPNGWICKPSVGCTKLQALSYLQEKQASLADRFKREGLVLEALPIGLSCIS